MLITRLLKIPGYEWEAIEPMYSFVKYIRNISCKPASLPSLATDEAFSRQESPYTNWHFTALLTGLNCRRGGPGGPADRALPGGGGAPGGRDGGRPGRQAHARQRQVSYGGPTIPRF